MAMQLLVGVPLEMVHGAVRIGLVYTCGVLAGVYVGTSEFGGHSAGICATRKGTFCIGRTLLLFG